MRPVQAGRVQPFSGTSVKQDESCTRKLSGKESFSKFSSLILQKLRPEFYFSFTRSIQIDCDFRMNFDETHAAPMRANFFQRRSFMRLREHPKIEWPPTWAERDESPLRAEEGILTDVNLIEPMKLLLSNEMDGKVYFAEIDCSNVAFASRLHEKIKPIVGRPIREVGELDF
jgi:hypothetical protein